MTIKEFIQYQKDFDSQHSSVFDWDQAITEEHIDVLSFLLLSLSGEVGEVANIVKKIIRGDFLLSEKKEELSEEISDIFIYILKLSYQLDIDIEEVYLKKMKTNLKRFKHYEQNK